MTTHGSRTNSFTYILQIFLLSSLILMIMMINHCDGSLPSSFNHCNGTMADCSTVLFIEEEEDGEQEFLMDTEEHRRILQTQKRYITTDALEKPGVGCPNNNCAAIRLKNVGGRKCTTNYRCDRGGGS